MTRTVWRPLGLALGIVLLLGVASCTPSTPAERAHEHIERADRLLAAGDAEGARAAFVAALVFTPEDGALHLRIGRTHAVEGRFGSAITSYRRARAADATLGEAQARWAEALVELGDVAAAHPRFLDAARLFTTQQDHAAAVDSLERAMRLRAGDPQGLHELGKAYLRSGRHGEAFDVLQRALFATGTSEAAYTERRRDLAAADAGLSRAAPEPSMPNVLLIVVDTLRADHLGAYGYPRQTSPTIDRLAAAGVVFEHAISQAPWTAPSLASLFTGLYPSAHGLDTSPTWRRGGRSADGNLPFSVQKVLEPVYLTLAEHLRSGGYRTAGFVSNVYANSIFGFAQGFDHFDDQHRDYSRTVGRTKRRAGDTNVAVFQWLDSGPAEPFFLLVHYNDPHWPYHPLEPYGQAWGAGESGRLMAAETTALVQHGGEPIQGLSEADLAHIEALYDGEIAYLDAQIGKLLERVESRESARPLFVVLTADHGEEFLDHGSASHGHTLFQEVLHVPLIIHAPARLTPRRVSAPVRLIDVAPTLVDLVGLAALPGTQGESLRALLEGKVTSGPASALSEATYGRPLQALQTAGNLKLIHETETGANALFDLNTDPGEQHDLAESEPAVTARLQSELEALTRENRRRRARVSSASAESVVLDSETTERLRALGYLQDDAPAPSP